LYVKFKFHFISPDTVFYVHYLFYHKNQPHTSYAADFLPIGRKWNTFTFRILLHQGTSSPVPAEDCYRKRAAFRGSSFFDRAAGAT
ncbi:MAG: hypothetical protein IKM72_04295, partial [Oscillospiraceae bacterium]|nr:hypothetical protein [Oscillospiraceae bacterium]